MKKERELRVGSRVSFVSRMNEGKGVVSGIDTKTTGAWITIRSKDHPRGVVTVRRSQVQ